MSSVEPSDANKLLKMCSYFFNSAHCSVTVLQGLRIGRKVLGSSHLVAGRIGYRLQWKSPVPGALAGLLSQALNLRSLTLQCVEALIEADTRVGDALAALKHLDTLEPFDIGPKTFEVAMRIESRPTSCALRYGSRDSSPSDLLQLMKIPLLARVRKLTLHRFQFGDTPMNGDLPGINSLHPWPAVEELRLSYCLYLPFYRLCPNLRVLSLWRTWQTTGTDMSLVALAACRTSATCHHGSAEH